MGGPWLLTTGIFLIDLRAIGFKFVSFSYSSLPAHALVQQKFIDDFFDGVWLLLSGSTPASPISITDFIDI
jgi:hypothetical protein